MHTTMVLTIELPAELNHRLRRALRDRPDTSLRDVALEALEEWLVRNGQAERQRAASAPKRS